MSLCVCHSVSVTLYLSLFILYKSLSKDYLGGRQQVAEGGAAALKGKVHKLTVLLHGKTAHDVGVLVTQDQHLSSDAGAA